MSTQTAPHLSHSQPGTTIIRSGRWSIEIAPAVRERFQQNQPLILLGALEDSAEGSLQILSARAFRSENISAELTQILQPQTAATPGKRLEIVGIFIPEGIPWDPAQVFDNPAIPVAAWLIATRDPESKSTRLSVLTRRTPTLDSATDILQTLQANLDAGLSAMDTHEPSTRGRLLNPSREALSAATPRPKLDRWAAAFATAILISGAAYLYFRPENPSAPSLSLSSWRAPEVRAPRPAATAPPAAATPVPDPQPSPAAESPTPRSAAKQYVAPATANPPVARQANLEEPAPPAPILTASNPPPSTLALPALTPPNFTPPNLTPPPPPKPAAQSPPVTQPAVPAAVAIEPAKLLQGGSVTLPPAITRGLPAGSAVTLAITVAADGRVQQVNATPTKGVPAFVVTQVQSAARSWKYQPARRGGQTLISMVTARVDLGPR